MDQQAKEIKELKEALEEIEDVVQGFYTEDGGRQLPKGLYPYADQISLIHRLSRTQTKNKEGPTC